MTNKSNKQNNMKKTTKIKDPNKKTILTIN